MVAIKTFLFIYLPGMTLNDSMNQHIELVLQMEQHPQFDNNSFASTQQVSLFLYVSILIYLEFRWDKNDNITEYEWARP